MNQNMLDDLKLEIRENVFLEITRQLDAFRTVIYHFSKHNNPSTTADRILTKRRLFLITIEKIEETYKTQTIRFILEHSQRFLLILRDHADIHCSEYTLHHKLCELSKLKPQIGFIQLPQQKQFPPDDFVLQIFFGHFQPGHISSAQMAAELEEYYVDAGYIPLHQKQYKRIFDKAGYTWTKDWHGNSRLQGVIIPPIPEVQIIPEQLSKPLTLRECLELLPVTLEDKVYVFCSEHNLFLGEIDLKIYSYANAIKDPNWKGDGFVYIYPMLSDDVVQNTYPELWTLLLELRTQRDNHYASVSNSSLHVVIEDIIFDEKKEELVYDNVICDHILEDKLDRIIENCNNLKDTGHNTDLVKSDAEIDFPLLENITTREGNWTQKRGGEKQKTQIAEPVSTAHHTLSDLGP